MNPSMYDPDKPEARPASLRIYTASDYATMAAEKGKREPDFTEHGVVGMDNKGDLWFLDWWSGQCETDKSIAAWVRLVGLYRPVRHWNEGGVIDKAIGPAIRRAMRESQRFVHIESLPSLQDKSIKLQSFHARVTAKTVHFPLKRKWAEDVIDQLVKFPAGRWDDKADVCGLIGRGIDQMLDARVPVLDNRPSLVPFTEAWLEYGSKPKSQVRFF
jgi:predicted phage terminase large subunit-like protein